MRHTPALIVEDEVGTPRLRIVVRCLDCDVTVTDRLIDGSLIERVRAGDYGCASGEEDANAWLAHAGRRA